MGFWFLSWPEGDDTASRDGNFFTRFWISAGTFVFIPKIKIPEAGKFDLLPNSRVGSRVSSRGRLSFGQKWADWRKNVGRVGG